MRWPIRAEAGAEGEVEEATEEEAAEEEVIGAEAQEAVAVTTSTRQMAGGTETAGIIPRETTTLTLRQREEGAAAEADQEEAMTLWAGRLSPGADTRPPTDSPTMTLNLANNQESLSSLPTLPTLFSNNLFTHIFLNIVKTVGRSSSPSSSLVFIFESVQSAFLLYHMFPIL